MTGRIVAMGPDLNKQWHRDHVLGANAPMDRRVAWHLEHAEMCGCRDIPKTVKAEIEARGLRLPERRGGGR